MKLKKSSLSVVVNLCLCNKSAFPDTLLVSLFSCFHIIVSVVFFCNVACVLTFISSISIV